MAFVVVIVVVVAINRMQAFPVILQHFFDKEKLPPINSKLLLGGKP